jgi:hypothetical protein
MANEPQKKTVQKAGAERAPRQGKAAGTSATRSGRSDPKFRRSLDDAAYNYMQDVRSAWEEYQQHIADTNETFMQTQRDAHDEAQKIVLEAQRDYSQVLQESGGAEESRQRVEEAQSTFVKAVRDAGESKQTSTTEAFQEYVSALSGDNDAAQTLKQRLEATYRTYLNAIDQIDISSLDPESLSLLSQNVATVAAHARGQVGGSGK